MLTEQSNTHAQDTPGTHHSVGTEPLIAQVVHSPVVGVHSTSHSAIAPSTSVYARIASFPASTVSFHFQVLTASIGSSRVHWLVILAWTYPAMLIEGSTNADVLEAAVAL